MVEMKRRDFMKREFIGLEVKVVGSTHPEYLRIGGRVVDETKNTLVIESEGEERTVPKPGNEFCFTYVGDRITVKGDEIRHRPEDRIKKVR